MLFIFKFLEYCPNNNTNSIGTSDFLLDLQAPRAQRREKAVTHQRRNEGVYNRVADTSVFFCENEKQQFRRASGFLIKKLLIKAPPAGVGTK